MISLLNFKSKFEFLIDMGLINFYVVKKNSFDVTFIH